MAQDVPFFGEVRLQCGNAGIESFGKFRPLVLCIAGTFQVFEQRFLELLDSLSFLRAYGNDRRFYHFGELFDVYGQPVAFRDIHHVERHDQRQLQFLNLGKKV